ncbi:MAG: DUF6798 domain-containing protein [Candidatus Sigynarchaeota archaeon]
MELRKLFPYVFYTIAIGTGLLLWFLGMNFFLPFLTLISGGDISYGGILYASKILSGIRLTIIILGFTLLIVTFLRDRKSLTHHSVNLQGIISTIRKLFMRMPYTCVAAIFTVLSFIFYGYYYAKIDRLLYIPFILHQYDPALFQRDVLLTSNQDTFSLFSVFMGALLHVFGNLEVLMLIIYVPCVFAINWSVCKISMTIFNNRKAMYITLVLIITPLPFMAKDDGLHPKIIAIAFELIAVSLILNNHFKKASIFLGFAIIFHLLMIIGVLIAMCYYLILKRRFREFLHSVVIIGIFALPLVLFSVIFNNTKSSFVLYDPIFVELVKKLYGGRGYFPLSIGAILLGVLGIIFICFFILLFFWKKVSFTTILKFWNASELEKKDRNHFSQEDMNQKTGIIFLTGCILYGGSIVISIGIPSPLLLGFQFHRVLHIVIIMFFVYLGQFISELIANRKSIAPLIESAVMILLGAILLAVNIIILIAFLLLLIIFFIDKIKGFFHDLIENKEIQLVVVFLSLVFLVSTVITVPRNVSIQFPWRPDDEQSSAWYDAQIWAKNNSPKDALFLTPYDIYPSFRIFSERSIVVHLHDSAAAIFNRDFAFAIYERYQDLANYDEKNADQLLFLSKKYGADYAVTYSGQFITNATMMYHNSYFTIFKIN